jgi:hypothetical protein
MFTAEVHVETNRAARYLDQLCRHVSRASQHSGHRPNTGRGDHVLPEVQHVERTNTSGVITTGWGRCTVQATPEALILRVEAADVQALQRLQDRVAYRLETIGRPDGLKVDWQRSAEAAVPQSGGGARKWRGRATTVGLVVVGLLIVAVHLGLFGSALAVSLWTGWATNIFLVLVLLKVLSIAAHVVLSGVVLRHPSVQRVFQHRAFGRRHAVPQRSREEGK